MSSECRLPLARMCAPPHPTGHGRTKTRQGQEQTRPDQIQTQTQTGPRHAPVARSCKRGGIARPTLPSSSSTTTTAIRYRRRQHHHICRVLPACRKCALELPGLARQPELVQAPGWCDGRPPHHRSRLDFVRLCAHISVTRGPKISSSLFNHPLPSFEPTLPRPRHSAAHHLGR